MALLASRTINADALATVVERLAKFNRKAAKCGAEPVVFAHTKPVRCTSGGGDTLEPLRVWFVVDIELHGSQPRLDGWAFVANVERIGDERLLHVHPEHEETVPARFRQHSNTCDHCSTDRRRRYFYILQHEDGRYVQVGKSCLRDFMGHSPAAVLSWSVALGGLDEDLEGWGGSGGGTQQFDLAYILTLTAVAIADFGWTSKGAAEAAGDEDRVRVPTVSHVTDHLFPRSWQGRYGVTEHTPKLRDAEPEETADIADAIAWAASHDALSDNDYLQNLGVLARAEIAPANRLGLVCSMLSSFRRDRDRTEAKRVEREATPESNYFGEVKVRADYELTVTGSTSWESEYGVTYLYFFTDAAGNRAKWFASREQELETSERYTIKATVKAHEEYEGRKETTLTRAKIEAHHESEVA